MWHSILGTQRQPHTVDDKPLYDDEVNLISVVSSKNSGGYHNNEGLEQRKTIKNLLLFESQ